MSNPNLLEDYVTLADAAKQPGMPSLRTLYRWVARRELPVTYLGRKPLMHVPSFREVLRARGIKVVAKRDADTGTKRVKSR